MWEKKTMDVPSTSPKLIRESEIILEPIVNHHTRKKGLSIVKINPTKIGFLILNFVLVIPWDWLDFLSLRIEWICKIEKNKIKIPPIVPINLNITSDTLKDENAYKPYDNIMIKGNSTMACPDAIFNPTIDPYLLPYRRLIKKRGPGDKTPEVETSITWSENSTGDIIPYISKSSSKHNNKNVLSGK